MADQPVMVRMRPDQIERIRRMAEEEDRSVAYMVRKAVDAYLDSQNATEAGSE
jgi:predicted transcriptional regulator